MFVSFAEEVMDEKEEKFAAETGRIAAETR